MPTNISPAEAAELRDGGAFLLDVREVQEWVAGHAPDAVLIPLGQLGARVDELPKDATILCICRSGARSGRAADALTGAGYDSRNVAGGMQAWESSGLPVLDEDDEDGGIVI